MVEEFPSCICLAAIRDVYYSLRYWLNLKIRELAINCGLWETVPMKPRRPTIKDSTQNLKSEGVKRKSQQVAARAARKATAKKAKLEAELAAARIVRE
jgi:hypothetical protein